MSNTAYTPLHSEIRRESYRDAESRGVHLSCDRQLGTRNKCVIALIVSGLVGGALTGFGFYASRIGRLSSSSKYLESYLEIYTLGSSNAASILPEGAKLLVNIILTFLIDSIGFIHTASLRWTLLRQGRLSFNSNLRLLSSAHGFGPNAWWSNVTYILATIVAYASAALAITVLPFGPGDGVYFPGKGKLSLCIIPVVGLGLSLLTMVLIATWSLLATRIPIWSSSPLHTVLVARNEGHFEPHPGRCMRDVLDTDEGAKPVLPKKEHSGALKSRTAVATIAVMVTIVDICLMVISHGLWARWFSSPSTSVVVDGVPIHSDDTGWDGEPLTITISRSLNGAHIYVMILLYGAVLWPITLCLHGVELIVNVLRDEQCWRTATSRKGCSLKAYDSITAACTNWRTVLLFATKAVIHWLFGLTAVAYQPSAYELETSGDNSVLLSWRPWQSLVLTHILNISIIFFVIASRIRKRGPQPTAYGHLQTLANLIDEWSPTLFWGHKRDGPPCHAGTSSVRLPAIHMNALYC